MGEEKMNRVWFAVALFLVASFGIVGAHHYELSKIVVKVLIEEGDEVRDSVGILGYAGETFTVKSFSSEKFISIGPDRVVLDESGGGNFNIDLDSSRLSPGVYVGEIIIESEKGTHGSNIPVILEVESFGISPLFDVVVEIPGKFRTVGPGEIFEFDATVHKLKGLGDRVTLYYNVRDLKGNEIFSGVRHLDVSRELKIRESFEVPEDADGHYVLSALAKDAGAGSAGTSADLFSVSTFVEFSPKKEKTGLYLYISFFISLILIIAFLIFNHYWNRKVVSEAKNWNNKLVELKKTKFSDVAKGIRKLEYQKKVLEAAYDKGYVKRNSYNEGKRKINETIQRLKKRL